MLLQICLDWRLSFRQCLILVVDAASHRVASLEVILKSKQQDLEQLHEQVEVLQVPFTPAVLAPPAYCTCLAAVDKVTQCVLLNWQFQDRVVLETRRLHCSARRQQSSGVMGRFNVLPSGQRRVLMLTR